MGSRGIDEQRRSSSACVSLHLIIVSPSVTKSNDTLAHTSTGSKSQSKAARIRRLLGVLGDTFSHYKFHTCAVI